MRRGNCRGRGKHPGRSRWLFGLYASIRESNSAYPRRVRVEKPLRSHTTIGNDRDNLVCCERQSPRSAGNPTAPACQSRRLISLHARAPSGVRHPPRLSSMRDRRVFSGQ